MSSIKYNVNLVAGFYVLFLLFFNSSSVYLCTKRAIPASSTVSSSGIFPNWAKLSYQVYVKVILVCILGSTLLYLIYVFISGNTTPRVIEPVTAQETQRLIQSEQVRQAVRLAEQEWVILESPRWAALRSVYPEWELLEEETQTGQSAVEQRQEREEILEHSPLTKLILGDDTDWLVGTPGIRLCGIDKLRNMVNFALDRSLTPDQLVAKLKQTNWRNVGTAEISDLDIFERFMLRSFDGSGYRTIIFMLWDDMECWPNDELKQLIAIGKRTDWNPLLCYNMFDTILSKRGFWISTTWFFVRPWIAGRVERND